MKPLANIDGNLSPRVRIVGCLLLRAPSPESIERKPPDVPVLFKGEVIKGMNVFLSGHELLVVREVLSTKNTRAAKFQSLS
jgi:hypothetical protein